MKSSRKKAPSKNRRRVSKRRVREFSVIIERDTAGYYVATVPELRGCHTQARSLDELMKRVNEAIALCVDVEGEGGNPEFIGVQRVAVAL